MYRGETITQDLSNEPKSKSQGENFSSIESVKSLITEKGLLQKSDLKVLICSSQKMPISNCKCNILVAQAEGYIPTSYRV